MFMRLSKGLAIAGAVLALLSAACATAQDEGANRQRIIAIGDLHGDYDVFETVLREAGLINKRGRWTGGATVLVQLGDVPDRGPDSAKIIKHLRKLQKQAVRAEGRVIALVGNHEAMNMAGDLRYVHPGEYEAFADRRSAKLRDQLFEMNRATIEAFYLARDANLSSDDIRLQWEATYPFGRIEHQRAWRPDGKIGAWVIENPAVAIVGDSLFVHGGVSEKYASLSVDELNRMVAEALKTTNLDTDNIINDAAGPLWYRGLVTRAGPAQADDEEEAAPERLSIEDEIDLVLETYGVERIIVAHTPSLTGIRASHGAKLIQVDTGLSAHYGGVRSFLEINGGDLIAHDNGIERVIGADELEGTAP